MRAVPTECPRCNSYQNFVPKLREAKEGRWQEEYIACTMCRYTQVLRITTPEIETAGKMFRAWQVKSMRERERHGMPTQTTMLAVERYGKMWRTLKEELEQRSGHAPDIRPA